MDIEKIHIEQEPMETKRTICILLEKDTDMVEYYKTKLLAPNDRVILLNVRSDHESVGFRIPYLKLTGYDHDINRKMRALHREQVVYFMKKVASTLIPNCFVEAYGVVGDKEQLLAKVQELQPNFIIMGREKSYVGSFTKYFLHSCQYPILIYQ